MPSNKEKTANIDAENAAKLYTIDDLQKAVSDVRARQGREQKEAIENIKENITNEWQEKAQAWADREADLTAKKAAVSGALAAYEDAISRENERLLAAFSAENNPEDVTRFGALLAEKSPLEAYEMLTWYARLQPQLPPTRPLPRPRKAKNMATKNDKIEHLKSLLGTDKK